MNFIKHIVLSVVCCLLSMLTTQISALEHAQRAFQTVQNRQQEDIATMRTLLDNNLIDVHIEDNEEQTLLHEAAENGHSNIAKLLIMRGADMHKLSAWGQTPLHLATLENKLDIVNMMLEHCADPNIMGNTSPAHCCTNDNIACIKKLVAYGADIDAIDSFGDTPGDKAGELDNQEISNFLNDVEQKNAQAPERILLHVEPRQLTKEGAQIVTVYTHATAEQKQQLLPDFRLYNYFLHHPEEQNDAINATGLPRAWKLYKQYAQQYGYTRVRHMTRDIHTVNTVFGQAHNHIQDSTHEPLSIGNLPAEIHDYIANHTAVANLKSQ